MNSLQNLIPRAQYTCLIYTVGCSPAPGGSCPLLVTSNSPLLVTTNFPLLVTSKSPLLVTSKCPLLVTSLCPKMGLGGLTLEAFRWTGFTAPISQEPCGWRYKEDRIANSN